MVGGWWPGEASTGWGAKVSRRRVRGERAGGAGLDGRKGQEEVRSALAGEGTRWDSEDQEGPATAAVLFPPRGAWSAEPRCGLRTSLSTAFEHIG